MIAVDSNILIYAHRLDSPFNTIAYEQMVVLAAGNSSWAIPWPCVHEFLSIVTNPRIYSPPTPPDAAIAQVDAWMTSPSIALLGETETHWSDLKRLLVQGRIVGARVHDARIAAICLSNGVRELWSADRDFSRFPGLKVVNPLVGG